MTVVIRRQDIIECPLDGGRTSSKGFRLVSRHVGSVGEWAVTKTPFVEGSTGAR